MNRPAVRQRLIVTADDFGASAAVNEAVIRAHTEGILTSASLMMNEPGCAEAVAIARAHPSLAVGLHLTLLCGRAGLDARQIPGLVRDGCRFSSNPCAAGMRYFFARSLRNQLRAEIHEQFRRFRQTGFELDHVNGHLHLHLHPVVLSILIEDAETLGIRHMRLPADPLRLNLRLCDGAFFYRLSHAAIFRALASRARPRLLHRGIRHTNRVFGLLQNGRVDQAFVLRLLEALPNGDSELYSHPSLQEGKHEFDALISEAVRVQVKELGIELIRYKDL